MEARAIERAANARYPRQRRDQLGGTRQTGVSHSLQAFRAHECQIDCASNHQQTLVGADVRSGLATAYVLFARLQRQGKTWTPIEIDGASNDAARHLPHIFHTRRHEPKVWAAGRQRAAERLAIAHDNIRAALTPLCGRLEHGERSGVHHRNHQRVACVGPIGERVNVLQSAEEIRLLNHQGRDLLRLKGNQRIGGSLATDSRVRQVFNLQALTSGRRLRYSPIVRMHIARHENSRCARFAIGAHRHQAGFRHGCGTVIHRGVGHLHAGQRGDHRLVFVNGL